MLEQKDRAERLFGGEFCRFSMKRIEGNPIAALRVPFWQHPAKKRFLRGVISSVLIAWQRLSGYLYVQLGHSQ
jgi:hypothetical protein